MAEQHTAEHHAVLLEEVTTYLTGGRSGHFLDATFGAGGHSRALLEADPANTVLALDCDPDAVARAGSIQREFGKRFEIVHRNFAELDQVTQADFVGVLFDFGVSSYHFDQAWRGFSFRHNGPVDMRMNPMEGMPASRFLQTAEYAKLVEAVRNFGEEPQWRRVVSAIMAARGSKALEGTLAFAELVESALGGRRPAQRTHPATRTFQGVRMAVNSELAVIETALPLAFARLQSGGRMAAISFHSLEDRIVKRFFRRMAGKAEHLRDGGPEQLRIRRASILTSRPVTASDAELAANPRSRSAKLRVIEKLEKAA